MKTNTFAFLAGSMLAMGFGSLAQTIVPIVPDLGPDRTLQLPVTGNVSTTFVVKLAPTSEKPDSIVYTVTGSNPKAVKLVQEKNSPTAVLTFTDSVTVSVKVDVVIGGYRRVDACAVTVRARPSVTVVPGGSIDVYQETPGQELPVPLSVSFKATGPTPVTTIAWTGSSPVGAPLTISPASGQSVNVTSSAVPGTNSVTAVVTTKFGSAGVVSKRADFRIIVHPPQAPVFTLSWVTNIVSGPFPGSQLKILSLRSGSKARVGFDTHMRSIGVGGGGVSDAQSTVKGVLEPMETRPIFSIVEPSQLRELEIDSAFYR